MPGTDPKLLNSEGIRPLQKYTRDWEVAKKEHTIDNFRVRYYMDVVGATYREHVKLSWNLAVLLQSLDSCTDSELSARIKHHLGL